MISRGTGARVSKVIRQVFGLADLRPGQQAVIDAVLAKRHTLAIMPTGAGKSLCYQVPAMLMPGMTVIVSPLIALMPLARMFWKSESIDFLITPCFVTKVR